MLRKIRIDPWFWFYGAVCLYVIPLDWMAAITGAALWHELIHILAVYATGGRVARILLKPTGAVITASSMSTERVVFTTLAGPVGSLLLIIAARWFPKMAVCGAAQGLFNLLPLYPLDGGRTVKAVLDALFPENSENLICWIGSVTIVILSLAALYLEYYVIVPVLAVVWLRSFGKIPCKECNLSLQ